MLKFNKICNILFETPYIEPHSKERTFSFNKSVNDRYNQDKHYFKLQKIININGKEIKCYKIDDNFDFNLYFMDNNKLIAVYQLHLKNNIYFDRFAWQDIDNKGILRQLFFEYILPTYKFIASDSMFSQYGKEFWRKNIIEGFNKGYNVGYIDSNKQLHQFKSLEEINNDFDKLFNNKFDEKTGIILYIKE